MAVVTITKQSEIVGYPFNIASGAVAAANDCIKFAEAGVIPFFVNIQNNATTVATSSPYRYAEVKATTTYDTDDTAIVYDGGTASERTDGSFYARNARTGEVVFVKSDSTPTGTGGTMTVVRGCLGTTAAAMADEDYLFCMNSLVSTGAATGTAIVGYFALPELHKATFF